MPKNSTNTSSSRPTRIVAIGATAIAVIAAISVATVVAQSAAADQLERRTSAQILNESTGMRSDQLALDGAILQKRTADAVAAAKAAAKAAADATAAAEAARLLSPSGAQDTARALASAQYGWGDDQFSCLVSLWNRESGWNYSSYNADSGAGGIPQALPADKMASVGADWQNNPATQIAWGLGYISGSYGTPCAAWGHSESYNWY